MKYRILGINDEQTSCDHCGKQNLKKVVWLENIEDEQIMAVGTTCAGKMIYGNKRKGAAVHTQAIIMTRVKKMLFKHGRTAAISEAVRLGVHVITSAVNAAGKARMKFPWTDGWIVVSEARIIQSSGNLVEPDVDGRLYTPLGGPAP